MKTTTKQGSLATVQELHRYTAEGTAERMLAAGRGEGTYLSHVTTFERTRSPW